MKTLINKANPAIRITAPEITLENHCYCLYTDDGYCVIEFWEKDWTLVEEEPVKEEICSKCIHDGKDDDYCRNLHGKRWINGNGLYKCTEFCEKKQEEPKRKQSPVLKKIMDNLTEEKLAKTRAEMKTVKEEPQKVNCPFDKGDCRYCTVQFCGAREENHIETHSTAEPVDLEEEIRKHTDLFQADIEYPLRLTAIKFYELGRKGEK